MTTMITEQRATYRAPGTRRRYLSRHNAFVAWAKHIIFSKCDCESSQETGLIRCDMHLRLFERKAWSCACGAEYDVPSALEQAARHGCFDCRGAPVYGPIPDNAQYLKVRDRLVRWLKWRHTREQAA